MSSDKGPVHTCLETEMGLLKPRELQRCLKEVGGVEMPGGGPSVPSSEVAAHSSSCCCVGSPFTAVTITEDPALPAHAPMKLRPLMLEPVTQNDICVLGKVITSCAQQRGDSTQQLLLHRQSLHRSHYCRHFRATCMGPQWTQLITESCLRSVTVLLRQVQLGRVYDMQNEG